jgi:hypothetical protein
MSMLLHELADHRFSPVEGLTPLERVNDVGLGRMAGSKN